MTILPQTSPVPKPILIFMPAASALDSGPPPPAPSATPFPNNPTAGAPAACNETSNEQTDTAGADTTRPHPPFPTPKLRLEIRDLAHPGAPLFLTSINAAAMLSAAVTNIQRLLYHDPSDPHTTVPPTRSVTLVLRDMAGVAYTTGSDLDPDHKEIHFSLGYIAGVSPAARAPAEITGVLTHELVHCYQWDGLSSCPGGLVEGIADWVRLRCDLRPPHWKREVDGKWDRGYQHTAYFLEYLEGRFGKGTVRRMNEKLRLNKYKEGAYWNGLFGVSVEELYGDYVEATEEASRGSNNK